AGRLVAVAVGRGIGAAVGIALRRAVAARLIARVLLRRRIDVAVVVGDAQPATERRAAVDAEAIAACALGAIGAAEAGLKGAGRPRAEPSAVRRLRQIAAVARVAGAAITASEQIRGAERHAHTGVRAVGVGAPPQLRVAVAGGERAKALDAPAGRAVG